MINKTPTSLLEQLNSHLCVDVDTMDSDFVRSLPITPHDMTSNPRFVYDALIDPRNKEIVEGAVKEMKGKSWEEVYAVCVSAVFLCIQVKRVIEKLTEWIDRKDLKTDAPSPFWKGIIPELAFTRL